jgi:hypothetical protein
MNLSSQKHITALESDGNAFCVVRYAATAVKANALEETEKARAYLVQQLAFAQGLLKASQAKHAAWEVTRAEGVVAANVARKEAVRARWVTLRARWVTLRARWVTLRAR